MVDLLATGVAIVFGLLLAVWIQRGLSRRERPWLLGAYALHVAAAFAQVWITRAVYGGGDMFGYHRLSTGLAEMVRADPGRFFPEVLALTFRQDADLPIQILTGATGSMSGIATLVSLLTFDSLYAKCVVFAIGGFFGTYWVFAVFRETFPARLRVPLLIGAMWIPSAVFWTSSILKESVAMTGFGLCFYGVHRLLTSRAFSGLSCALLGALIASLVKPYILVTLIAAAAVYAYWIRSHQRGRGVRIRPVYLVLATVVAVFGIIGFGELFPRYAVGEVTDELAGLQTVGARISGGSNYMLAEPGAARSIPAQLALAPLALVTALWRPFLFEISGVTMAVNALETFALTALFVHVLVKRRWRELLSVVTGTPLLMFCVVFVALFGTGVGLGSTNLGSLSRYRVPLMPLWVCLLVVWRSGYVAAAPAPRRRATEARFVIRRGKRVPVPTLPRVK